MTYPLTPHHHSAPASAARFSLRRTACAVLAFAILASAAHAADAAPAAPGPVGFWDALGKGKFSGAARYRYEIYEQDSVTGATTAAGGLITGTAIASTLRLSLAYETAAFNGFAGFVDLEGLFAVGENENYRIPNHPTQTAKTRAIIADPLGSDLNQAFVKWQSPKAAVKFLAGREAYALNNGRFISFSGWRQNNQTIDLVRGSAKLGAFTAGYGYLDKVRRVVGPDASDGILGMNSHVLTLDTAKPGIGAATLYGLWLDYDLANQAANDTASVGLRLTGPYKLNDTWSLIYTADFAHQSDYADNALNVSLDYATLEFGFGYKAHRVFAGWTQLEGGGGTTFRTPLAHPFNGWVEKFLNTPANGLEALYFTATGPVSGAKSLTYTFTYYDYRATTGSAHYGSELDAALEWKAEPIHKNLTLGWRFGNYYADTLFTDSLRTSVYAAFRF